MIEREYALSHTHAQQKMQIIINAGAADVFDYLSTAQGISSWFPELSFNEEKEVLFDMGDGTYERMAILEWQENESLAYEWGTGQVKFHLVEHDGKTKLTFYEVLPLTFESVSQDFAGWYFQMKNIKDIVEKGSVEELNMDDFNQRKNEIENELFN